MAFAVRTLLRLNVKKKKKKKKIGENDEKYYRFVVCKEKNFANIKGTPYSLRAMLHKCVTGDKCCVYVSQKHVACIRHTTTTTTQPRNDKRTDIDQFVINFETH